MIQERQEIEAPSEAVGPEDARMESRNAMRHGFPTGNEPYSHGGGLLVKHPG